MKLGIVPTTTILQVLQTLLLHRLQHLTYTTKSCKTLPAQNIYPCQRLPCTTILEDEFNRQSLYSLHIVLPFAVYILPLLFHSFDLYKSNASSSSRTDQTATNRVINPHYSLTSLYKTGQDEKLGSLISISAFGTKDHGQTGTFCILSGYISR